MIELLLFGIFVVEISIFVAIERCTAELRYRNKLLQKQKNKKKKAMTNNLESKEVLSAEILNAIDLIIKTHTKRCFGGSIALNAVGLINRKVSDIDLFFHLNENLTKNGFLLIVNDGQILSDTVTNVNGVEIQRTGAKIAGVKTCCFKVSDEEMQHSKIEFLGRKICVQNVNYAIMAKK